MQGYEDFVEMIIDVYELIQTEVIAIKNILDLKINVIWTTNIEAWRQGIGPKDKDPEKLAGHCDTDRAYMFINLSKIQGVKELRKIIFHEMAHIKYPKYPEHKIRALEAKYLD